MDVVPKAYSVGELTFYVKHKLENDPALRSVWVEGEISNLTRHSSGHVYFTLKDKQASLSCVMFRNAAMQYPDFPRHGEKIRVQGDLNLYPPRGQYQLICKALQRTGLGDLHQRFLQLKDTLQKEGLFAPDHKQKPPRYPSVIGVVTSPTGAVWRDIVNTLRRRFPHVKVLLSPAKVQGQDAGPTLVKALKRLQEANEVDVILLCRGGGSLEDLWCFNEAPVARAIFDCPIPIISGVGHETDTTIADFVADLRAPTPTAAAELAVPSAQELRNGLDTASSRIERSLEDFIQNRRLQLDGLTRQLEMAFRNRIERHRHELKLMEVEMQQLDMRKVLERGYSVTLHEGKPVTDGQALETDTELETIFHKGRVKSRVTGQVEP